MFVRLSGGRLLNVARIAMVYPSDHVVSNKLRSSYSTDEHSKGKNLVILDHSPELLRGDEWDVAHHNSFHVWVNADDLANIEKAIAGSIGLL